VEVEGWGLGVGGRGSGVGVGVECERGGVRERGTASVYARERERERESVREGVSVEMALLGRCLDAPRDLRACSRVNNVACFPVLKSPQA
jgi:hypothetical protein